MNQVAEKPFGWDLEIEIRTGMVGTETRNVHYRGTEKKARRQALMQRNFVRVVKATPLTEKQWISAYGSGRM